MLTFAGPSSVPAFLAFFRTSPPAKPGKHTRSEESAADTRTLASTRQDVSFGKARPLELRSFKGKANIGPHVFWPSGKCPNLVKSQWNS